MQPGWSFPAARFPGSEEGEAQAPVVILVSLVRGCEALREMLCLFPSGCGSSRALSAQPRPFLVSLSGLPLAVGISRLEVRCVFSNPSTKSAPRSNPRLPPASRPAAQPYAGARTRAACRYLARFVCFCEKYLQNEGKNSFYPSLNGSVRVVPADRGRARPDVVTAGVAPEPRPSRLPQLLPILFQLAARLFCLIKLNVSVNFPPGRAALPLPKPACWLQMSVRPVGAAPCLPRVSAAAGPSAGPSAGPGAAGPGRAGQGFPR